MKIDIQLSQGSAPWPLLREAGEAAEHAGFSTLWNLDHFSGDMFGADSMLECFTSLAAWASTTTTIGLGTLVTNINNRHPGLLANCVSSIQQISGNRFTLGVGAGASPNSPYAAEQRALGIDVLPTMLKRHEYLVESVELMRSIWSIDRDATFAGFPRPDIAPKIVAGVNSIGLASIAGQKLDGVNTRFNHEQRALLLNTAIEASGNKKDFDVSVWSWFVPEYGDPDHPFHKELAAEGVTRLIMLVQGAPDTAAISSTSRYLKDS